MNPKIESPEEIGDDFFHTLGDKLPDSIDPKDPTFRQAYKDVMGRRISEVERLARAVPKFVSGQRRPHRLGILRTRRLFSRASLAFAASSLVLYWASWFISSAIAGSIAVLSGLGLAVCLLGEVLYGSGVDVQTQYMGSAGPFREYSFEPSIQDPVSLFSLLANAIACVVLGYAAIYLSLTTIHLLAFSKDLELASSVYFSLVTFATVGYGDFYPDSMSTKLLVCTEIVVALFVLAVVLATSTSWILSRRQELSSERKINEADRMQRTENAIKVAGIGLYQDDTQLLEEIQTRMEELRMGR